MIKKVALMGIYRLKLEFYNTDRKMKNILRHIFISIIMRPNFMHCRQKISFKSALESFASNSWHLKTASRRISKNQRHSDLMKRMLNFSEV